MDWLFGLTIALAALAIILFAPIGVQLSVFKETTLQGKRLRVNASTLGGLILISRRIRIARMPGGSFALIIEDMRGVRDMLTLSELKQRKKEPKKLPKSDFATKFINSIYRRIRVRTLKLSMQIGLPYDAAKTAMLTGAVSAAVHALVTALYIRENNVRPQISIMPNFDRAGFDGYFQCIIVLRAANIITAAISANRSKEKKVV